MFAIPSSLNSVINNNVVPKNLHQPQELINMLFKQTGANNFTPGANFNKMDLPVKTLMTTYDAIVEYLTMATLDEVNSNKYDDTF